MKILVAGFQHETNTFAPTPAAYDNFIAGEDYPRLARGAEVLNLLDVNLPISGFTRSARSMGHRVVPVIWAGAGASAHVTVDAYERIVGEIVDAAKTLAFDAIYLDLHGAMVARHVDDGEGELLSRLRRVVGTETKIVVTVDSHANVTRRMLDLADGVIAYRTYPHVDMAATGQRAAEFLAALCQAGERPHRAVGRVPFLIPINSMSTMSSPAQGVYALLEQLEPSVLSLSFAPGFPASDFEECGPVVWGYGFDPDVLQQAVDRLLDRVCQPEDQWAVRFLSPDDAVRQAMETAATATRPVVIADTQDNPGAGGDSNTTGMLRALLSANAQHAAIGLIFDPAAAAAAHQAGVGKTIELKLGGCPQVPGDEPLCAAFEVEALSHGSFVLGGAMMNGKQCELGPMACLKIGGVRIAVSSVKAQMLDRNMYRAVGIEPESMKILVNKSSVHFRADFAGIAESILVARAPGPFIADPAALPWTRLAPGMRPGPNAAAFIAPTQPAMTDPQSFHLNDRVQGAHAASFFEPADLAMVQRDIASWPGYAPTPLVSLDDVARAAGVGSVLYKDEGGRFGLGSFKALGGSYAVQRLVAKNLREATGRDIPVDDIMAGKLGADCGLTVACATDGNHGRSVAWAAQLFGLPCFIYVHANVSLPRQRALEALGATVVRVDGVYDDAVRRADEDAKKNGWTVVSDTSYPGYTDIPADVMLGYTVMLDEILAQAPQPITHVFVQCGVGAMPAAVCAYLAAKSPATRTIVVEPERAACLLRSAQRGDIVNLEGDMATIMAGLACGHPSQLAWKVLHDKAFAFMTAPEELAVRGVRMLAKRAEPVVAGETGTAGLAGLLATADDEALRRALQLDASSVVLLIGTEGATDPELYARLVALDDDDVPAFCSEFVKNAQQQARKKPQTREHA
ncbi:diaminopropionate ammonia-lyase [Variovorax sp. KK3]|nr:diaminopropionate ammonia-lyase [Variovorax sp. KK3]